MKKDSKLKIRAAALLLAATSTFTLVGCSRERTPDESYDTLVQADGEEFTGSLTQVLDVKNNNFKLVANYSTDERTYRSWRITSDKFLYIDVHTEGLDANTEVYIDNVHIDTSLKSDYAIVDGIKQDTMDDHVHSSNLIGFAIDNNTHYYGIDQIEGYNDEFINATTYAYNGFASTTITNERITEKQYIDKLAVTGNKISIVYDLLIKKPEDKDFANVSVKSDFVVDITDKEKENGVQKV